MTRICRQREKIKNEASIEQKSFRQFQITRKQSRLTDFPASDEASYGCEQCGRAYRLKNSLRLHRKYECGKEPQFKCPCCPYVAKLKGNLNKHVRARHFVSISLT